MSNRGLTLVTSTLLPTLLGDVAIAQPAHPNNMFTASGFVVRHADTAEKHALLSSLPANKLVTRKRDGKTYYVYADPHGCRCAYVGTPEAYANYQRGGPRTGFDLGGGGGERSPAEQLFDDMNEENAPSMPGAPNAMDFIFGGPF
jgi:hypothetical protein